MTCGTGVSPALAAGTAPPQNSKVAFRQRQGKESGDGKMHKVFLDLDYSRFLRLTFNRATRNAWPSGGKRHRN